MAKLELVIYPDPRLRQKATAVDLAAIDLDFHKFVDDLQVAMYTYDGVGLAANQVGDPRNIFVIDGYIATGNKAAAPLTFINPEILENSTDQAFIEEGCLSFPGISAAVKRHLQTTVKAWDPEGKEFTVTGVGVYAQALQHEMDHLAGRLLIDNVVSIVTRRRIERLFME